MTYNVLFSSAGRRVELILCFRRAAAELGLDVALLAADAEPEWSPACHVADASIRVPRCTDSMFIPAVLEYCVTQNVRLIVPTIDTELLVYAASLETFRAAGIDVLVSSPEFVALARDKRKTMEYFASLGLNHPQTWYSTDERAHFRYPLIAKPVDGSCSVGMVVLRAPAELETLETDRFSYLFQELCGGREYTVNAYYEDGFFRCAVPHERVKTRSGEVLFGETRRIPALETAARRLAEGNPAPEGVICFQAFCNDDADSNVDARLIEINARFGGGYPLCDHAGGRFARWILQKRTTGRSEATDSQWNDRVRMLRYDAAVFYNEKDGR